MRLKFSRRRMLVRSGQTIAVGAVVFPFLSLGKNSPSSDGKWGAVVGNEIGAKVGQSVLADGGNAVDAAVAAALASGVASPNYCGAGGYGGHLIVARSGGKKVECIDFNTAAPGAARADMYPRNEKGEVVGASNRYGWLASGVPGTLAGLQLALKWYGTRSFAEVVQPCIKLARQGVPMSESCAAAIRNFAPRLRSDPGSAKIYLTNGDSPKAGDLLRNPEIAELYSTLGPAQFRG